MLYDNEEQNEKPKKKPVKRAICKLAGDTTYFSAYLYGSIYFNPRKQLDYNYGYLVLEQEGEDADLKVKYGKMWLMETIKGGMDIPPIGFAFMKYPHQHGDCDNYGHWNPQAQAHRDKLEYYKPWYTFDLPNYELVRDESYCPHGDCDVVNFHETVVPGTMWGDSWHDYIQGKALKMYRKKKDGSIGETMACCNLYHYAIKELEGDDPQDKKQLGMDLSEEDSLAVVVERHTFRELWEEDFKIVLPEDLEAEMGEEQKE